MFINIVRAMDQNKKTAITAIIAIVAIFCIIVFFKLGSPTLTGLSNLGSGTATITIGAIADITLIDANISFGNGTVTQGAEYAIINTCGQAQVNGTWAPIEDYFILENSGSLFVNVTIRSVNGAGFIGGNPGFHSYYYNYTDNESSSCLLEDVASSTYWNLSTTASGTCAKLNFSDPTDTIKVCLKLQIPSDAPPELKSDQITFVAEQTSE